MNTILELYGQDYQNADNAYLGKSTIATSVMICSIRTVFDCKVVGGGCKNDFS